MADWGETSGAHSCGEIFEKYGMDGIEGMGGVTGAKKMGMIWDHSVGYGEYSDPLLLG